MKTFVVLALFAFVVLVSTEIKLCEKNSECDEDECCLHKYEFGRPFCTKLGEENDFCSYQKFIPSFGRYYFDCPCSTGLECKAERTEVKEGVTINYNSRCVKKATEEVVTEEETEE